LETFATRLVPRTEEESRDIWWKKNLETYATRSSLQTQKQQKGKYRAETFDVKTWKHISARPLQNLQKGKI
jgi:hypothetical protein